MSNATIQDAPGAENAVESFRAVSSTVGDGDIDYRPMSMLAMVGFGLGVVSPIAFLQPYWAVVSFVGLIVSALAWRNVATSGGELTGLKLAKWGVGLTTFCGIASWVVVGVVYATEVPENYTRITFQSLKPEPGQPDDLVRDEIKALAGKKVFVKGYVRPDSQKNGLDKFLLVRDNGACCYGDSLPKPFDMIQVVLKEPLLYDYNSGLTRVGGILRVPTPEELAAVRASGVDSQIIYFLEGDYLN